MAHRRDHADSKAVKKILVIGIGAGDPDHLTLQAVKAINRADVFFLLDKGTEKAGLVELRRSLVEQHARAGYRVLDVRDPDRDRDRAAPAYTVAVEDWRRQRADLVERLIRDELADGETGAFLVWGDPSLYDSTILVLDDVQHRATVHFDYDVVPGISSISALAARHRTTLTRVGRPLLITTGRRLAGGIPDGVDDVVVMLDAHCTFTQAADFDVHWGAYLGTPDEILVSGQVADVAAHIKDVRADARARKGWIMDTYLLRRSPPR